MTDQKCAFCDRSASKRCSACLTVAYCSAEHQKEHWKIHKEECTYYRIIDEPEIGKGFVATRDIKEGTIILDEAPAVFSSTWNEPSCITCGLVLPLHKRHRCPKCSWPVCSLECSKMAVHADNECNVFASKALGYHPVLLLRIDLLSNFTQLIRACCLKKKNPGVYEQIVELCSEYTIPEVDVTAQMLFDVMMPHLKALDLDVEDVEMKLLLRIFLINSHGPTDYYGDDKCSASCLYIKASRINHSCIPNCSWVVSQKPEFKIRVRTAIAVKKGDPLTVAYYKENVCGTKQRQERYIKSGFTCKCARCLDPTELGTYISAIGCNSCKPSEHMSIGYLLPGNPLDMSGNASWKCNNCGCTKLANEILAPVENLRKSVLAMFQDSEISDDNSVVEMCESFVRKNSGTLLHPNHWVIQNAKRAVVDIITGHPNRFKAMEFAVSKSIVKYGLDLLAIQDILSPGLSQQRAGLQHSVGGALQVQMKYLWTKKAYQECVTSLEKAIDLQKEALKYFKGDFPKADGTHCSADALIHNIELASKNLESVFEMII